MMTLQDIQVRVMRYPLEKGVIQLVVVGQFLLDAQDVTFPGVEPHAQVFQFIASYCRGLDLVE